MSAVKAFFYRPSAWLSVRGEDAPGFLQGQFSNDLGAGASGTCVYGLWLDRKGRVLADGQVLLAGAEDFFIHSYFSDGGLIRERLESHIIADDVEVSGAELCGAVSLFGAGAAEFIEGAGGKVPGPGAFVADGGLLCLRGRRSADPSFEVLFTEAATAENWKAAVAAAGVQVVSEDQLQLERIRSGIPAVPIDIGPGDLPAEGGLEGEAVSFSKGCFIGQEVVARMRRLGRVRRCLYSVSGPGLVPEAPAELLDGDGRMTGELRSAAPANTGWIGLALLKRRDEETGGALRLGDRRVEVVDAVVGGERGCAK